MDVMTRVGTRVHADSDYVQRCPRAHMGVVRASPRVSERVHETAGAPHLCINTVRVMSHHLALKWLTLTGRVGGDL